MGRVSINIEGSEVRLSKKEFLSIISDITKNVYPGGCDIQKIFKNIKVLDSDGKSAGTVFFAKFKPRAALKRFVQSCRSGEEVFMKIGHDARGTLLQEAYAYAFVRRLIDNHRTPNFMQLVMHFTCRNFDSSPLKDIVKRKREGKDTEIIVLERGKGKTLDSLLYQGLPNDELLEIIFQLGYSLQEMNLHGLRHNDVHIGNVWIEKLGPQAVYIPTSSTRFVVRPRVKIFDFDHSSFTFKDPKVPENKSVDAYFCAEHGECSNVNDNQDFFKVLTNIFYASRRHNRTLARKVLEAMVLDKHYFPPKTQKRIENLNSPFIYNDVVCQKYKPKEKVLCKSNSVIPKKAMRTFTQLVTETNIFDKLKSDKKVNKTYRSIVSER